MGLSMTVGEWSHRLAALVGLTTSEAIRIMKMGFRKRSAYAYVCVERANVTVNRGQLQKSRPATANCQLPTATPQNDHTGPVNLSTCHLPTGTWGQ